MSDNPHEMIAALEHRAQGGRPSAPARESGGPAPEGGISPEASAALEERHALHQDAAALLAKDMTRKQLEVSELLGRIRAVDFLHQFTGMARLKWLKEMKESKAYKGCKTLNAQEEAVEITSFESLCALIGVSRSKVTRHRDQGHGAGVGQSLRLSGC